MENSAVTTNEAQKARESIKVLHWRDMIFLGKGSFARRIIHALISIALRLFFRRIEASNVERVPRDAPVIFVLNHPNGLVDPALVFVSLPRRVSFLAKSTLFEIPVGGWLLRTLEALPVYRRIDASGDLSKNQKTFAVCRRLLAKNRCIAIFPEGISHDETKLKPIKTGAARIALGALGVDLEEEKNKTSTKPERLITDNQQSRLVIDNGQSTTDSRKVNSEQELQRSDIEQQTTGHRSPITDHRSLITDPLIPGRLQIMAVGLFYTSKTTFRSEALIRYGEIFEVEPVIMDDDGEPPREAVLALTDKIESALRDVTLNLESQTELDAVLKAEALFSSVYQNLLFKETLTHSFHRLQRLAEKYQVLGENEPEKMRDLNEKISAYERELKSSGVTAESLSVLQHPTWYVFRYLILRLAIVVLLAPLSIVGAILHSPGYLFSNLVGVMFKTHGADAAGSTYKILAAMLLMPLTWLVAALAVFYFFGWQMALVSIPLVILAGYAALRSAETLVDLSVWVKAAWLLFRQRALFLRLLVEREGLQREIGKML